MAYGLQKGERVGLPQGRVGLKAGDPRSGLEGQRAVAPWGEEGMYAQAAKGAEASSLWTKLPTQVLSAAFATYFGGPQAGAAAWKTSGDIVGMVDPNVERAKELAKKGGTTVRDPTEGFDKLVSLASGISSLFGNGAKSEAAEKMLKEGGPKVPKVPKLGKALTVKKFGANIDPARAANFQKLSLS